MMKTPVKVLLSLMLLGSMFTVSAQRKATREYVADIPAGRNILMQPLFGKDKPVPGKIKIDFTIDKKGNVTTAHTDSRHSTITNRAFIRKCEAAVQAAKFSEMKNAPAAQHGSLTYSFKR